MKLIQLEDCLNKTIKNIHAAKDYITLVFTDRTSITIKAETKDSYNQIQQGTGEYTPVIRTY